MDGRGRWMDNVFIERLWRSMKYEDIYLKGYADGREAARGIAEWIAFYNERRPHQALTDRAPMAVWREAIAGAEAVDMMDTLPRCPHAHSRRSRRSLLLRDRKERRAAQLPTKKPTQAVPLRECISLHGRLFTAISYLDLVRNGFIVMVYDFEIPSSSFGDDGTCSDHGFWLCRKRKRADLLDLFPVVFVSEIVRHTQDPSASRRITSLLALAGTAERRKPVKGLMIDDEPDRLARQSRSRPCRLACRSAEFGCKGSDGPQHHQSCFRK